MSLLAKNRRQFIYMIRHPYAYRFGFADNQKIGSTIDPAGRIKTYYTYYITRPYYFRLYEVEFNCKVLDDDIKVKFNSFNVRDTPHSGIEFYRNDLTPTMLESYFSERRIVFKSIDPITYTHNRLPMIDPSKIDHSVIEFEEKENRNDNAFVAPREPDYVRFIASRHGYEQSIISHVTSAENINHGGQTTDISEPATQLLSISQEQKLSCDNEQNAATFFDRIFRVASAKVLMLPFESLHKSAQAETKNVDCMLTSPNECVVLESNEYSPQTTNSTQINEKIITTIDSLISRAAERAHNNDALKNSHKSIVVAEADECLSQENEIAETIDTLIKNAARHAYDLNDRLLCTNIKEKTDMAPVMLIKDPIKNNVETFVDEVISNALLNVKKNNLNQVPLFSPVTVMRGSINQFEFKQSHINKTMTNDCQSTLLDEASYPTAFLSDTKQSTLLTKKLSETEAQKYLQQQLSDPIINNEFKNVFDESLNTSATQNLNSCKNKCDGIIEKMSAMMEKTEIIVNSMNAVLAKSNDIMKRSELLNEQSMTMMKHAAQMIESMTKLKSNGSTPTRSEVNVDDELTKIIDRENNADGNKTPKIKSVHMSEQKQESPFEKHYFELGRGKVKNSGRRMKLRIREELFDPGQDNTSQQKSDSNNSSVSVTKTPVRSPILVTVSKNESDKTPKKETLAKTPLKKRPESLDSDNNSTNNNVSCTPMISSKNNLTQSKQKDLKKPVERKQSSSSDSESDRPLRVKTKNRSVTSQSKTFVESPKESLSQNTSSKSSKELLLRNTSSKSSKELLSQAASSKSSKELLSQAASSKSSKELSSQNVSGKSPKESSPQNVSSKSSKESSSQNVPNKQSKESLPHDSNNKLVKIPSPQKNVDIPAKKVSNKKLIVEEKDDEEKSAIDSWVNEEYNILYQFQKEAADIFRQKLIYHKKDYFQGVYCLATGLGKSHIMLICCLIHLQLFPQDNILWVCFRNDIIDSLAKHFEKYPEIFVMCNRGAINIETMQYVKGKVFVILRQGLVRKTIPNNLINGVMYDECHDASTIGTVDKNGDAIGGKTFDMLTSLNLTQKLKYRIGFSATPLTSAKNQNQGIAELYGDGKEVNYLYKMSMLEGVEQNCLSKPDVTFLVFDNRINLKGLFQSLNKGVTNFDGFRSSELAIAKILAELYKIVDKMTYKKGILWFSRVHAQMFFYNLIKDRYPGINIVYSTASESEADQDFRVAEKNIIMVACRKFTTGFDAVNLEFGVNFIMDEKEHGTVQKIGRFTRKKAHQKKAYFFQFCCHSSSKLEIIMSNIDRLLTIGFDSESDFNSVSESVDDVGPLSGQINNDIFHINHIT